MQLSALLMWGFKAEKEGGLFTVALPSICPAQAINSKAVDIRAFSDNCEDGRAVVSLQS